MSKFFFQILTLLGRGRAVASAKFFFQILTLLGRGRAVSKFFFQILTRPWPSSVKIFFSNFDTARPWPSSVKIFFSNFDTALLGRGRRCPYARARACLHLLSYEIAARAFTQWPSAMAVSREVKVTTRALCAHCPSLNFVVCQRLSETVFDDTYITCN